VPTVAAARSEQHGGAKGAAIPLRLSVVVGMISAHTVRHPSHGKQLRSLADPRNATHCASSGIPDL